MYFNLLFAKCDAPEPWQIGVQDPAYLNMEGMIYFHHYLMFSIILIGIFVCWMLLIVIIRYCEKNNTISKKFAHLSTFNDIWDILPAAILLFISIPSFLVLSSAGELPITDLTIRIIGKSSFYTYEYSDFRSASGKAYSFESYMYKEEEFSTNRFKLLWVDTPHLVLPTQFKIHLYAIANNVPFYWNIPSLGVHINAVPNGVSHACITIEKVGVYYGECTEVGGVGHSVMPILVKAIPRENFKTWIMARLLEEEEKSTK